MRIRKLELQGFKSFADRATFHFGPGISAVVGPNGCGKSNVVDAVRWCIGEQSVKSLRGESMSDVIFAGSPSRPAVSFGEVSLGFVAAGEPFPGTWARFEELEVTRRLYRDGTSEYLVNQEKVRLRDVTDLFLDTGVGNRLYSFIEQGRIGQIVHARPEQRRTLIEEAAGISRYKARRDESMDKLASTRQSLERVADLVEELQRQLRAAERAVKRALAARSLAVRLRQEQLVLSMSRFGALVADRRALGERVRAAGAALEDATRAVQRRVDELDERRALLQAVETEAGTARDRAAQLEADRRVEESAQQYQAREAESDRARARQLDSDLAGLAEERAAADRGTTEASAALVAAEAALAAVRAELEGAAAEHQAAHAAHGSAAAAVAAGRAQATAALERLLRGRAAAAALEARKEELGAREARRAAAATVLLPAHLRDDEERRRAAVHEAEAELASAREAEGAARATLDGARGLAAQRRASVGAAEAALADATREAARIDARMDALVEMERSDVDLPDGARAALATPGATGPLARELDVPPAVEPLLSRALQGALDTVIVPSVAAAVAAAGAARGKRARILVVEPGSQGGPAGLGAEARGSGVARAALAALLPSAEVVDSVAQAYAAWTAGTAVVCRDGALLRADGLLVLGQEENAGIATLRRRRELGELRAQRAAVPLERAAQALAVARGDLAGAEAEVARSQEALDAQRTSVADRGAVLAEARHRLLGTQAEIARFEARAAELIQEAAEIDRLGGALAAEAASVAGSRGAAEVEQANAEQALRDAQVAFQAAEPRLQRASERVSDLRMRAQAAQHEALTHQAAAGQQRALSERAAQRAVQANAEMADLERRQSQRAVEVEAGRAKIESLANELGSVHAALAALRDRVRDERERAGAAEEAERAARARRDEAKDRHVEAEGALQSVRAQAEALREDAEVRLGVSLAGMLDRLDRDGQVLVDGWAPDPGEIALGAEPVPTRRIAPPDMDVDAATATASIAAIAEALSRAGDPNPGAIEEYREVQSRHDELERQRADLAEAADTIDRAIATINATCRERFRETFDRVAEAFAALYPRLVGGGMGRLDLVNADDLLDCGVEIVVQPPGKRVQVLSLLSGGEKAMAAIALIFALFTVKPSPFCLLDEVDAPLDEGNGARFNDMLKEMALASQFIVITHNKKTMEAADVLYGVTMPEPGASRLVSVKLE